MADDVLRHVKDGHSLAHAIVDTVREALIVLDRDLRVVYRPAMAARATPQQRLSILAAAMDWVLSLQHEEAARETLEEGKKRAQRRYGDAVLALSKAFALASASDEAAKIRDEVAFFQAVRSALTKSSPAGGKSAAERELAIQQINKARTSRSCLTISSRKCGR